MSIGLSPPNLCLVSGNDLRLYSYSNSNSLRPLCFSSDFPSLRTFHWHPTHQTLLALGLATGKISLVNFVDDPTPCFTLGSEFTARNARCCTVVAWNPIRKSILLSGFEKARNDVGLLIWDVERLLQGGSEAPALVAKYGSSQGVASADWKDNLSIVGIGNKYIRGFDLRDKELNSSFTINSKAIRGITCDPNFDHRFASYSDDGNIKIWDMRSPIDPLLSIQSDHRIGISGLSWCPSNADRISAIGKECNRIRMWTLQDAIEEFNESVSNSSPDPLSTQSGSSGIFDLNNETKLEDSISSKNTTTAKLSISNVRSIKFSDLNINHMAWIPNRDSQNGDRIIVCSGKEWKVDIFEVPPLKYGTWSPTGTLGVTESNQLLEYSLEPVNYENKFNSDETIQRFNSLQWINDISSAMLSRAKNGYGMDCVLNQSLVDDKHLNSVWKLAECILQRQSSLFEIDGINYGYLGLRHIVKSITESQARNMNMGLGFPLILYLNPLRNIGLSLCGWQFINVDTDHSLFEDSKRKIENQGDFEKAAGLTFLYYADLSRTIDCLNTSRDERLMLVAAALAGGFGKFSSSSNRSIWQSLCRNLSYQLQDPYLRALFCLMATEGDWSQVLGESSLPLSDRMVMALRFLDDTELHSYVDKWTDKVLSLGRIDGLLLTGWSDQGIDLMQNYVDQTGDIQTASLILSITALPADPRLKMWITEYSDILDRWELFHVRAKFDIHRRKVESTIAVPPQIYIRCHFCNQGISPSLQTKKSSLTNVIALANTKPKNSVCPSCLKLLPRCSLCLLQLGSHLDPPLPSINTKRAIHATSPSRFDSWFAWCQTCNHGGHTLHLFEWFQNNSVCPVSHCECVLSHSPMYRATDANEYLVITGINIQDVKVTKKAMIWPGQRFTKFSLTPMNYTLSLHAMTVEKLEFTLPAVFTIGPEDTPESILKYARLLAANSEQSMKHIQELVTGIVEGETRVIAAGMTMEEIFKERKFFKEHVLQGIQSELTQFGMIIYNANVKQLQDSPGSEYFKYLRLKSQEGAINQAKVDVAQAKM
ncbi:hypothetical protein BC833DRAFT_624917, partial [Globomyces pollinis-pini]